MDFLLTSGYWFDATPTVHSKLYVPLTIVFALFLIFGFALLIFGKGDFKKISDRYIAPFIATGIMGFIYLFARYEQLPGLASRFALALIMTAALTWILILLIWSARFVPKFVKDKEVEEKFKKYLPKAKKA